MIFLGLLMGLIFSTVKDLSSILTYIEFLPAHFLEVFTFLLFALLIGLLFNNLIHFPFKKYIFQEVQGFVSWHELGIVLFWAVLLLGLNYFTLQRRDIKG